LKSKQQSKPKIIVENDLLLQKKKIRKDTNQTKSLPCLDYIPSTQNLKKKTKEQCKQISVSYMNKMQDYVQKRKPLTAESYSYILFGNDHKKSTYWSPEKKITKQNLQQLDDLS